MQVPLYGRRGVVKGYALIDESDWMMASKYRWHLGHNGYAYRSYRAAGRVVWCSMHRDLLGLPRGDTRQSDHINRDPLDNRRSNLRIVTCAENQQNRGSVRGSSSAFCGVTWNKSARKWQAAVKVAGRSKYLGLFADESRAGEAVRSYRREVLGVPA